MLRFVNFQKFYGDHPALSIHDFTIDAGVFWIKGANGSGKSTLLNLLPAYLLFMVTLS